MNPWQMILLQEAEIGLRAIFAVFAAKYFSTDEQAAVNLVISALVDLPHRIRAGVHPALTAPGPKKIGRPKKNA